MNILIVGLPQSGKTTLMKTLLENYSRKTGFSTNEIRENGIRTGFEIETSKWEKSLFASTKLDASHKIGKYSVDISTLENMLPSISHFPSDDILFIDEIWPMEILSQPFQNLCTDYLNAPNLCIATSQLSVNNFTEKIQKRADTTIFKITSENRDAKLNEILRFIHSNY